MPSNVELHHYIILELKNGKSETEIKKALIEKCWSAEAIDAEFALIHAGQTTDAAPSPTVPSPATAYTQTTDSKKTSTGMTILTIAMLWLFTPIGIILMWTSTSWSKAVKWIVTIVFLIIPILTIIGILVAGTLVAVNPAAENASDSSSIDASPSVRPYLQPDSVKIDAGAPLQCDLLLTPKQIDTVTATYGCAAPGAYLEAVNVSYLTGSYFTTNSQGTTVTSGPTEVPVLEILP